MAKGPRPIRPRYRILALVLAILIIGWVMFTLVR